MLWNKKLVKTRQLWCSCRATKFWGDDCVAISGGSSHLYASGIACGTGQGVSIGSLGRD